VYFVGTIIRAAAIYSSHLLEKIEINSSVFQTRPTGSSEFIISKLQRRSLRDSRFW